MLTGLLILAILVSVLPVSCSTISSSEPLEIVSVTGPILPFNPGGPKIEIVLKNVSKNSVVSLSVQPEIKGLPGQPPYNVNFDVSDENPLQPGQNISATAILINGGFQTGTSYPMTIQCKFQDGKQFSYPVKVEITFPPAF